MAIKVDGIWGPVTKRYFQQYLSWKSTGNYTRAIDGDFGYYSVCALQRWLNKPKGALGSSNLLVDGVLGAKTCNALHFTLKFYGITGPNIAPKVIRGNLTAMVQRWINRHTSLFK